MLDELKGGNPLSPGTAKAAVKTFRIIGIIAAALIAVLILNPFVIVGAGERGVVMNFGAVQDKVLDEGLHVRVPLMQKVIKMDVRVQKSQTDAEAASKDLQDTHSINAL